MLSTPICPYWVRLLLRREGMTAFAARGVPGLPRLRAFLPTALSSPTCQRPRTSDNPLSESGPSCAQLRDAADLSTFNLTGMYANLHCDFKSQHGISN